MPGPQRNLAQCGRSSLPAEIGLRLIPCDTGAFLRHRCVESLGVLDILERVDRLLIPFGTGQRGRKPAVALRVTQYFSLGIEYGVPMPALTARTATPRLRPEGFDAGTDAKVDRLVAVYGVNGLASLLGVSASQPTRWRQRKERPSDTATRRLLALEYLTSRLAEVFTARQAQAWLASPNPYLGGSTPAQVFTHFGGAAVEVAISAVEIGAAV